MTKNKQFPFFILIGILAINLIYGYQLHNKTNRENPNDKVESVRVLVDAVKILRKNYVDQEKVTYKKLVYSALRGMIKELDKHSQFHNPKDNTAVKEDTNGQFAGIGVTLNYLDKKLVLKKIIPDGPASRSDLKPGDIIVAVDNVRLTGQGFAEAKDLIKGEKGTSVLLTVARAEVESELSFTLIRDIVTVPSVIRSRILPDTKLAYIHLVQFSRDTAEAFEKELKTLTEAGAQGLIIDLRGNPGGMLTTAVKMCSFFLNEDDLVIYTKGRDKKDRQDYTAIDGEKFRNLPIVLLVDEGSASASEILAACLQDYGKAVLVGVKTYGKGSVQTIVDLRDGSAIRFTIAKYYTKSNRTIHNVGISPDVPVKITKEERLALRQHLSDLFPTESEYGDFDEKDSQLKAAIGVLQDLLKVKKNEEVHKLFEDNKEEILKKYSIIKVIDKAAEIKE
jgi:carboxyl-terminal processing protease